MGVLHAPARLIVDRCPAPGQRVSISGAEAAHARARRLAAGDDVVLLDGSGAEAHGRIVRVDRRGAQIEIARVVAAPAAGPGILLAAAGLRPDRMAWMAEKATELGARRFLLLRSERTQAFRAAASLPDRLTRVVEEAAKQSQSARWPSIEGPWPLADLFARERDGARLLLDSSGEPFPSSLAGDRVALAIGPEGGWSDAELRTARGSGWLVCSLPAGKLRAETAAVAALVLARAALARSA